MLLTNDGDFENRLMHPRHQINNTYKVTVNGFSIDGLEQLKRPVAIDGYTIQAPEVKLIREFPGPDQKAILLVTIHEGRNRQVRKMCAIANMAVTRLIRVQEGALKLGDLPVGTWRYLTDSEVSELMR